MKVKHYLGHLGRIVFLMCLLFVFTSDEVRAAEEETEIAIMSENLQIKEDAAIEKYNLLLKRWAYNLDYIDDIDANFPEFYGGAYIDDNKELVIQVTSLNDSVRAYFGDIISLTDVSFKEVEYSFEQLKEEQKSVSDKLVSEMSIYALGKGITGVGISVKDNSISLHMGSDSELEETVIKNQIGETLSSFENVNIVTEEDEIQPLDVINVPLYPGNSIVDSGGGIRSVGFWATKSNGDIGIVTTPHGLLSKGEIMKKGSVTFGVCDTPYFNGSVDAVFVKRTNANIDPSRVPAGFSFSLKSNAYTLLPEGATVYQSGVTSGAKVGTVKEISYTSSDLGFSDLVVLSCTSANGDSGGIIAGAGDSSVKYVAGIILGSQGSTNNTLYIKSSKILSTLGISVY